MANFQLYVDETGDFSSSTQDLLVAGILIEGYGTPQLDHRLRRRITEIFVGVPYPPHAAHHNLRASLLWAPLGKRAVAGPAAARFHHATAPATELALGASTTVAAAFRDAVLAAPRPKDIAWAALRDFDRWLVQAAPHAHALLVEEALRQRADLAAFLTRDLPLALPGRRFSLIAAWHGADGREAASAADLRYAELYEALLERAAAFVGERGEQTTLWVHLAARGPLDRLQIERLNAAERAAVAHPLLRRAASKLQIVRSTPRSYGEDVPGGIVLADLAANVLGYTLRQPHAWSDVARSASHELGLAPEARSGLVATRSLLPSIEAGAPSRAALRLAAEGKPATPPPRPLWAREQAAAWIAALGAEVSK
jgi:hypothetical protein